MNSQPNFTDEIKAHWCVVPGSIVGFVIALSVGLSRIAWASWYNLGAIEAFGLFTPWFNSWIVAFVLGMFISTYSYEIDVKAKTFRKARMQCKYGDKY